MAEIMVMKNYGVLCPADEEAEEIIKGMKHGQAMRLKYSLPRNYENHKRFFAFIRIAFDAQDHFADEKIFRKYLEMRAGHFDTVVTPTGKTLFMPKSISFADLDEVEFRELFGKAVNAYLDVFGNRLDEETINEIVRF